jgi:DnaJ-class molecular chaperone
VAEVLGIRPEAPVDRQKIRERVAELAKQHHPDRAGGDHNRMAEINAAADHAMEDVT